MYVALTVNNLNSLLVAVQQRVCARVLHVHSAPLCAQQHVCLARAQRSALRAATRVSCYTASEELDSSIGNISCFPDSLSTLFCRVSLLSAGCSGVLPFLNIVSLILFNITSVGG